MGMATVGHMMSQITKSRAVIADPVSKVIYTQFKQVSEERGREGEREGEGRGEEVAREEGDPVSKVIYTQFKQVREGEEEDGWVGLVQSHHCTVSKVITHSLNW